MRTSYPPKILIHDPITMDMFDLVYAGMSQIETEEQFFGPISKKIPTAEGDNGLK